MKSISVAIKYYIKGDFMKRFIIYIFCTLMLLECTGCQNIGGKINDEAVPYDFPDVYTGEKNNVIFDTEIIVNEEADGNGLYETTAKLQTFDYEKAYDTLFSEIEIKEHTENEDPVYDRIILYTGTQESEMLYMVGNNHLTLSKSGAFSDAFYSFHLEGDDYNADLYLTGEEFAFKSIDEAYRDISEVLKEIGLNVSGKYNCYSLNYKMLEENEYVTNGKGEVDKSLYKDEWTEEDNEYFFAIHQTLQDCVVQYPVGKVFIQVCDANAPVQVLYTNNGIEEMNIYELFTFEQSKKLLKLKGFDEIADAIAYKYNMLLTDDKYEVVSAELFWRPVEIENKREYDMIPAWEIKIYETSTEKTIYMYVNALTAEEML